jgi:hypothetical protein
LANKGKRRTAEHKLHYSQSKMKEKNPMYGKIGIKSPTYGLTRSEEQKKKHSEFMRKRYCGLSHPNYKGGLKLAMKRSAAKRRTLGHEFLNAQFQNSDGHHINKNQIVFIPIWLHKNIYHRLDRPETMEQINKVVWIWATLNNISLFPFYSTYC